MTTRSSSNARAAGAGFDREIAKAKWDGRMDRPRPADRTQARARVIALFAALAAINGAAWIALLVAARGFPMLLPLGITAYVLGLRHAVDADHIAAIDGTTRKLMHQGKPAESVGFFFSLGHSTIVVVLSVVVAAFGVALKGHLPALQSVGDVVGTWISAIFLLVLAAANAFVLIDLFRRPGGEADAQLGGGLLSRFLQPALKLVNSSAQMYPVGVLFGLGFDTASEVALLGISAASGAGGMPIAYILILPWLFTAGMSLVDTAEGYAIGRAYGWASIRPARKLLYNFNMTALTIALTLFVGAAQAAAAVHALIGK
jgi:nickel/cobalt transporter (NiCoT) family protein